MGMYEGLALELKDQVIAELKHALAEKDQELAIIKHEYAQLKEAYDAKAAGVPLGPIVGAQTIINQQIAYQQLMEKAVQFAEWIGNDQDYYMEIHVIAKEFLDSPEVQAWKERQQ